eukprot:1175666-Prorocentrum_minimum.AAC.3
MRARDVNHGAHASSSAPSPVAGRAATKRRSIRRTGHLNVRPWLGRNLPGTQDESWWRPQLVNPRKTSRPLLDHLPRAGWVAGGRVAGREAVAGDMISYEAAAIL